MARVYLRETAGEEVPQAAVRGLLREVLHMPSLEVSHDALGKPLIPGGPEISISHTKNAVAAAIGAGPLGVDVEAVRPIADRLPERVLSAREYGWFVRRGRRAEDFFTLWTLKESYYKYLGTGLPGIPNGTDFYLENGVWRLAGAELRFDVWEKNLLRLALCSQAQQVECIFFSES